MSEDVDNIVVFINHFFFKCKNINDKWKRLTAIAIWLVLTSTERTVLIDDFLFNNV